MTKDPVLEMYEGLASEFVTVCDRRARDREQFQRRYEQEHARLVRSQANFHSALWIIVAQGILILILGIACGYLLRSQAKGAVADAARPQVSSEVKTGAHSDSASIHGGRRETAAPDFQGGKEGL